MNMCCLQEVRWRRQGARFVAEVGDIRRGDLEISME